MDKKVKDDKSSLIFWSDEDRCWIAHSFYTDQIGTGSNVLKAFTDMIRAVDQVFKLAQQDKSVVFHRRAPEKIFKRAKNALPLPEIFCNIAKEMAKKNWPDYLEWILKTDHNIVLRIAA